MQDRQFGLIDGWLRTIRDLYYENRDLLAQLPTEKSASTACAS
jgi:carbonic anhydrase